MQGPLRFGKTEGAEWAPLATREMLGPAILGSSVALGGAPGYLTEIHANASDIDTDPSTDAVQSTAVGSTWSGRTRLSAAGADDIRLGGVGLSISAAAAGPAFMPNDTVVELSCLIAETHRWFNGTSNDGQHLRTSQGCSQAQRAMWAAGGLPVGAAALLSSSSSLNVSTCGAQNDSYDSYPWEELQSSTTGLHGVHNESSEQLIRSAAAAGSEWAMAAFGQLQAYAGGELCSSPGQGAQWR